MGKLLRASLITVLTAFAAVGFASPAVAHVTVSGTQATQGGYGILTFSVPTESDTASTTELRVTLPDDHPILTVDPQHKPGWTATITKKDLPTPQTRKNGSVVTQYVSQVDWKADSPQAAIPPNQFDMFSVDAGRLPNAGSLALPAEQFYSDGHTVNFNQSAVAGRPIPANPTPVLALASETPDQNTATTTASAQNSTPMWPGIVAFVVAIIALLIALANFVWLHHKS